MSRRLLIASLAVACTAGASVAGAQTAEDEPNDLVRQAGGPLAGGAEHAGRLTGSADRDWFVFYAAGPGDVRVTVTNTSSAGGCTFVQVALLDTEAEALESFGMEPGDTRTIAHTADGRERLYVRVDNADGCTTGTPASYTLRVDPAEGVTTTAPPGLKPPRCQDARDRLAVAQKALRRARGAKQKRAARRRAATARRAIDRSC